MDDDVKSRFDDFDKRFQTLEKRFDDVKWYFGGTTAFFAVFISLFTLIANSNLNSQKNDLLQFKNDLRADLGKAESFPDVELLAANGRPLAGEEVTAEARPDENGTWRLHVHYVIRNAGTANTGAMFMKVYGSDPLRFSSPSTDEGQFKYEDYVPPASLSPNDIPGGNYTSPYTLHIGLQSAVPRGTYPLLLKIYFGKGKVAQARFVARVE